MRINQLNIMKWNVIKYLLKSSEPSGPSMDRHFWNRNESRVAKSIESLEMCNRISYRKESSERNRQIWKKIDIRKCFEKRGGWGWGFDLLWLGQVWWVTICVTNRALPYSMSDDILQIVLCRGLVRRVVSLPKESLRKCVTDFFKTFKIVDFRRNFWH